MWDPVWNHGLAVLRPTHNYSMMHNGEIQSGRMLLSVLLPWEIEMC